MLFLHGFGGDLDNWLFNLDTVAAAAPVIALDLPAHGQSDVRLPGGAALADLAGFVLHFLEPSVSSACTPSAIRGAVRLPRRWRWPRRSAWPRWC